MPLTAYMFIERTETLLQLVRIPDRHRKGACFVLVLLATKSTSNQRLAMIMITLHTNINRSHIKGYSLRPSHLGPTCLSSTPGVGSSGATPCVCGRRRMSRSNVLTHLDRRGARTHRTHRRCKTQSALCTSMVLSARRSHRISRRRSSVRMPASSG